jgi:hypothetical protein
MCSSRPKFSILPSLLWILGGLALLAPGTAGAQSFDFKAAFPDLPGGSELSPPATKAFSVTGPGILVIRTWLSPLVEVNTSYNSGGIFFAGKSPDPPFPDYIATRRYQNGRVVGGDGPEAVYGIDMYIVSVVELHNKTYSSSFEVHPSVRWSLGGQMEYQTRWTVRITMEVHPPGTDPNLFLGLPPASAAPAVIVSYPKIKEFSGDYKYSAREDGVVLVRNPDGQTVRVGAGGTACPVAERFKKLLAGDPGLARQLGDALTDEVSVYDDALRVQVFRGGALIYEKASGVTWISRHGPRQASGLPKPAGPPQPAIEDTAWIVNGHPVPWEFHRDGVVEARGLWKGSWVRTAEGIEVTLVHQTASDRFVVKVAPDGKTFTAYKNGQGYRSGVRSK